MRQLILALTVVALAGCGTAEPASPPAAEGPPTLEESKQGSFTLYVSNQSFDRKEVDIRVSIDGRPAVDSDFAVEDQHNWVEYRFELDDGPHALQVESLRGEAVLARDFEVKGKRWAVVDYWCCNGAGEPKFTFSIHSQPVAFA